MGGDEEDLREAHIWALEVEIHGLRKTIVVRDQ